jgi:hypothetical protein
MKAKLLAVIGTATLLAACGQTTEAASNAFDTSFAESCKAAAVEGGVPTGTADTLCTCGLRKINEQYSATEKLSLSNEQVQPLVQECLAEVVQNNG